MSVHAYRFVRYTSTATTDLRTNERVPRPRSQWRFDARMSEIDDTISVITYEFESGRCPENQACTIGRETCDTDAVLGERRGGGGSTRRLKITRARWEGTHRPSARGGDGENDQQPLARNEYFHREMRRLRAQKRAKINIATYSKRKTACGCPTVAIKWSRSPWRRRNLKSVCKQWTGERRKPLFDGGRKSRNDRVNTNEDVGGKMQMRAERSAEDGTRATPVRTERSTADDWRSLLELDRLLSGKRPKRARDVLHSTCHRRRRRRRSRHLPAFSLLPPAARHPYAPAVNVPPPEVRRRPCTIRYRVYIIRGNSDPAPRPDRRRRRSRAQIVDGPLSFTPLRRTLSPSYCPHTHTLPAPTSARNVARALDFFICKSRLGAFDGFDG